MPLYHAKQGDCIASIAWEFGFNADTIWNHPKNTALKKLRQDLHVLYPGDVVFIPDKKIRLEERPTDRRHTFVRKGMGEVLSLRFLIEGEPRAGERYVVIVDGRLAGSGVLDSDGCCTVPIRPASKSGSITLGDPDGNEIYQLSLGKLDPVEEISGVKSRLSNLAYLREIPTGEDSPALQAAIAAFQRHYQLPENGLDDLTREKLKKVHGS